MRFLTMPLVHLHLHLYTESWIEKTGYTEDADTPKIDALHEVNAYIRESGWDCCQSGLEMVLDGS